MNIRRGFFRLTLVSSILIGIVSSFWVLEHTIESKHGILYRCLPYGLQIGISNEATERVRGKIIKEQSHAAYSIFVRLKTHQTFGPDYILYWWRHLAVLSLPGFVTVWFIYGLTGWVIIPLIARGFQGSSAKGGGTG